MSMSSIRQLNSGGLKLKTNFNAKAIARNMASGRSLAASFVKGGYNTFGSNSIFTPARRIGGTPRYMNAAQISSRFNGQNFSYAGESIPSYSGVNYAKNFTMGTSDAFNTGMGVGSLLNLGISAYQQLKDMGIIGGEKDLKSKGAGDDLLDKTNLSTMAVTVTGDYATALSQANSFSEINKIENDINQKKAALNTDYKKIGTDAKQGIDEILQGENVQEGLELANVDIDTSVLELSELDPENLEGSIKTIVDDIKKIGDFKTNDLVQAKNSVNEESAKVSQELNISRQNLDSLKANNKDGCNNAKIRELERRIEELEQEEKQLKAAEKAIDEITSKCADTIKNLESKKSEIEDMKKAEDGMKDKKYDLAKSQDEELGKTMQKLEKLNKEINELMQSDKSPDKYDKKDEKRANKLSGLMAQRTGLYTQLGQLVSSLSSAGETTFKNSKNQSYTIKNLEKANNMLSNQPTEASGGGTIKSEANILTDSHPTNSAQVVKGQDEPINGGAKQEVNVTGKMKDLSKVSDQYLQNALEGALSLGDSEQIEKIQAEISRRAGLDN